MRPEPINLRDIRASARRKLPSVLFDLIEGAADDELARDRNLRGWSQYTHVPTVGVDVSTRAQQADLFGVRLSSPVILAPTGLLALYARDGDRAAARAVAGRGTAFVLSTVSMTPLEDVVALEPERVWFQLYMLRERATTEQLVRRVEAAGVRTLFVTMDVPVGGARERDVRNGLSMPFRITRHTVAATAVRPRWTANFLLGPRLGLPNMPGVGVNRTGGGSVVQAISSQFNSTLSWADIAWLRGIWPHTLVTKGIMSGADAERAIDAGADGVIVSNHGGRQLGSAPATVDVLPEVVAAVGARVPVVVDGGIRRGTDVLTALALGARAVQIGRPYLFGLAHGGQRGVELVLDILARELDRSLALSGHCSIDQLDGIGLARRPVNRPR